MKANAAEPMTFPASSVGTLASELPVARVESPAELSATLDGPARKRIEAQVSSFLHELGTADLRGEDFRQRMDQAFRLGRKEIADATRLNSIFLQDSFRSVEGSTAYAAMNRLRQIMDDLNPGKQGDLLAPRKLLRFIPLGNRLKRYLSRFVAAGEQIENLTRQLCAAQDDLERDVIAIDEAKAQLWSAIINLKSAAYFAQILQRELQREVATMRSTDPERARALEQEALFYATQNLDGILAQYAVTINGFLALEPLKKTARELYSGIDRLKTTGLAALSVAQMVAVAVDNQVHVAKALAESREIIGDLIVQTSNQLGNHCATTARLASEPAIDLAKLQAAFDNTFKAIETMDNFRSGAIETMTRNNQALQALIDHSRPYLERSAGLVRRNAPAEPVHL